VDNTAYSISFPSSGPAESGSDSLLVIDENVAANGCSELAGDDSVVTIDLTVIHIESTLRIEIAASLLAEGAWGIRNFQLFVDGQCHQRCSICQQPSPT
jgi:hypothetical protein